MKSAARTNWRKMLLLILLPSLSIAQYDMNPGNFGVIEDGMEFTLCSNFFLVKVDCD